MVGHQDAVLAGGEIGPDGEIFLGQDLQVTVGHATQYW